MTFLTSGAQLVLATHNRGKVVELADLLEPYDVTTISAAELQLAEPEETGTTFMENVILKAEAAVSASNLPALADDSGLEVFALQGQPGVHSARWAGEPRDFAVGMQRVHDELLAANAPQPWLAKFVCVLALAFPNGTTDIFFGDVEGHCVWPPRGENGFGYDPMFVPLGHKLTFGEMKPTDKEAISHRHRAFDELATCLPLPQFRAEQGES